jgi:molybdopterin molybdotransferase
MIPFSEAVQKILAQVEPSPVIQVRLAHVTGYALAHPVLTASPIPRFDASAMDGFGVHASDVAKATPASPIRLRILNTIRAGDRPTNRPLPPGSAVKILTGAPVPAAVDAIAVREICQEQDGEVFVTGPVRLGEHIRRAGHEFQAGDTVLPAGTRISPPVVGLLATLGYATVPVHRKPTVGIVVTGSELVRPGHRLRPGKIYDANSFTIDAALREMHLPPSSLSHAEDDPAVLQHTLSQALARNEVILAVGGVSVGDYDFVRSVCEEMGVVSHCWQIAIKPAKPTYFGTLNTAAGRKLIFGLPGNPVSALLAFQQFVRPALLKMLGARDAASFMLTAVLAQELRKRAGRHEFVRGIVSECDDRLVVTATTGQDSHMLGGLAQANCLIHFPAEYAYLPAGSLVNVELLMWA